MSVISHTSKPDLLPTLDDGLADRARSASAVSWGAILAGAAAAAALSLILLILGVGLGLSSVSPWTQVGVSATTFGVTTILWITFTQLAASGMGGYLAGRLRTKWISVHTDEVYFRDTAHGFLAWAVASLATAALLSSVIGSIIGTGVQAGATAASGAVAATAAAGGSAAAMAADTSTKRRRRRRNGLFRGRSSAQKPRRDKPAGLGRQRTRGHRHRQRPKLRASSPRMQARIRFRRRTSATSDNWCRSEPGCRSRMQRSASWIPTHVCRPRFAMSATRPRPQRMPRARRRATQRYGCSSRC